MRTLTRSAWLAAHPYLASAGELAARIESALDRIAVPRAPAPRWEEYAVDHGEGVPILESPRAGVDPGPAGNVTAALVERLAGESGLGDLPDALLSLVRELRALDDAPRTITGWLLGNEGLAPSAPGLLRCLGWLSAERYLRPVRAAYVGWRDEEKWLRPWCPVCGSGPAMAQLSGTEPGRMRRLVCGGCACRWQFRRTQCPFCGEDSQKLSTVVVDGEAGLRIDSCESCRGYLKAYDGEGNEDVLLADWTSLHLDLLARDRGLVPRATSLFALDAALPAGEAGAGAASFEA